MSGRGLAVLLLGTGLLGRASDAVPLTSARVHREIQDKGAKATVERYWAVHSRWEALIRYIEGGDSRWLNVASELRRGSDAGSSEDLAAAMGVALTKNPAGVLRAKHFELSSVCQVPYLEVSEKVVGEYKKKASAALASVGDSDLKSRRDECRASILAN